MKTLMWAACILFLLAGCKKNNTPNTPKQDEKPFGPFNIYSGQVCNNNAFVLVNHTGKKKVVATSSNNAADQSPEFYLKKSGDGYIVYVLQRIGNDSTFWVWAESKDSYECPACKSGSGVDIVLETFKKLDDVSGGKYIFRFNPDGGGTTIQVASGAYVFYGDGIERATQNCNRLMSMLISGTSPDDYSREFSEWEKIFDYSFTSTWFFKKKN